MERENVVITGARRGLGKTLAYLFASKGYNLVINDKEDLDKLNEIKRDIETKYKVTVLIYFGDISKEDKVLELLSLIKDKYKKIDVLINNAAIVEDMEIKERSTKLFNETIENNITSVYLMSKYLGELMYKNKKGRIINISSTN